MSPKKQRKFPVKPLAAKVGNGTVLDLSRVLGVKYNSLTHWIQDGIPEYTADRVAVKFGFHPVEIWPEWFDGVLDETGEFFARLGAETGWSIAAEATGKQTPRSRYSAAVAFRRLRTGRR